MNILIESVSDPVWGTLLPYLRPVANTLVGIDTHPFAFGLYAVDRGYLLPESAESEYFARAIEICRREKIDLVVPSRDSGLYEWAIRKESLVREEVNVLISPPETVAVCQDKWETYRFFINNKVPTPRTSLEHEYELIKPRSGEGGHGILRAQPKERGDMTDRISQEFLSGEEISVDALCGLDGEIIYTVSRQRLCVESGRSAIGKVVKDEQVKRYVRQILKAARFIGAVNIQCFRTTEGIFFTEINPRISGGLSLSMAATENWFEVISRVLEGASVQPKRVKYGLMMIRTLADCIIHERELLK